MLEYFIFWMVPFGVFLQKLKGNYRIFTTVLICILVLYCQFEIYQYRYNMIYWDGISGEEYWDIFLKLPS
jgi:glycopeptide antibiotics resistance protein